MTTPCSAPGLGLFGSIQDGLIWKDVLPSFFCLALVAWSLFLIVFPFRRTTDKTEEEETAAWLAYRQQLAAPDFAAIELQSGKPLPDKYKELFAADSVWLNHSWDVIPAGPESDGIYEVSRLRPAVPSSIRGHPQFPRYFLAFAEAAEGGDEF